MIDIEKVKERIKILIEMQEEDVMEISAHQAFINKSVSLGLKTALKVIEELEKESQCQDS